MPEAFPFIPFIIGIVVGLVWYRTCVLRDLRRGERQTRREVFPIQNTLGETLRSEARGDDGILRETRPVRPRPRLRESSKITVPTTTDVTLQGQGPALPMRSLSPMPPYRISRGHLSYHPRHGQTLRVTGELHDMGLADDGQVYKLPHVPADRGTTDVHEFSEPSPTNSDGSGSTEATLTIADRLPSPSALSESSSPAEAIDGMQTPEGLYVNGAERPVPHTPGVIGLDGQWIVYEPNGDTTGGEEPYEVEEAP